MMSVILARSSTSNRRAEVRGFSKNPGMATIPELLDGHITLEVECLDRLYLNGYICKLATGPGLSKCMRFQLGMPVKSPVVLGRVSERFREAVKAQAEREDMPF